MHTRWRSCLLSICGNILALKRVLIVPTKLQHLPIFSLYNLLHSTALIQFELLLSRLFAVLKVFHPRVLTLINPAPFIIRKCHLIGGVLGQLLPKVKTLAVVSSSLLSRILCLGRFYFKRCSFSCSDEKTINSPNTTNFTPIQGSQCSCFQSA